MYSWNLVGQNHQVKMLVLRAISIYNENSKHPDSQFFSFFLPLDPN